ncbi:MAG TPA: hypothetical protein VHY37_07055, partial [Tepidisphaeraceae bacterium]|nr:hypothetical protein [Tepidisphaeraceae bacterium]
MNRACHDSRLFCVAAIALLLAMLSTAAWADPVDQAAPAAPRVVYLLTDENPGPGLPAPLERELYRQAFLIAARDGLGLQTRDQSLRE